jgi:hypothetical protein
MASPRRPAHRGIPQPTNPPIEQLAADLRRMLWHHDRLKRSPDVARRAFRLGVLESAISDCAKQAARALDLPCPNPPARAGFDTPQLRRLLRALAAAGLVLTPAAALLGLDHPH